MDPLARLGDLLHLKGWRAGMVGFVLILFIAVSRFGYLPPIGDTWTLLIALAGFICIGLSFGSGAEVLTSEVSAWRDRKRKESFIKRQQEQFIKDIGTFSEVERNIFGYLRENNTKSFLADANGEMAATLIGRGYIRSSTSRGQILSVLEMPFIVPDHIWDVVVSRPDDFPFESDDSWDYRGKRPPWRTH